ncbi:radical SAM family heme chaperone HemW [Lacrimispora sp. NSJ-141]|uniref:Heme chaperone HemW n=1 Tax=Lientehia hominis TaxID=2897778 RepID=A0AAP2RJK2_9FIRM|nr:radical SAM family heme chaperone HemW [Lientehia hominis]MCD2492830.1 radical SAM family heme chaperone HemW [Lientehia hominis]
MSGVRRTPLELYVHVPFCIRKCAYCDFVSGPADAEEMAGYVKALLSEIQAAGRMEKVSGYEVVSVFFGGGTPSILKASDVERVLKSIRMVFFMEEGAEITLEANPGTLTPEKLTAYRRAGINRLSLGLQSSDDRELALLGRIHTFDVFLESYRMVRDAGFSNVNVDLMAALPGQTEVSFRKSLEAVAELEPVPPEHVSVYSLIIEEGTPFYAAYHEQAEARAAGEADTGLLPSEEAERNMYYMARSFLKERGYDRYEISNFSRAGYECRHNIGYWTGVSYLGFGISASSYIEGKRFINGEDRKAYVEAMGELEEKRNSGAVLRKVRREEEIVTKDRAMEEFMFLGLRMMCGVSEKRFAERFGVSMEEIYGPVLEKMARDGLMVRDGIRSAWKLTEAGIDVSNYVLADFLL